MVYSYGKFIKNSLINPLRREGGGSRAKKIMDQEPNRGSLVINFQFLKTHEDNYQECKLM